MTSSKEKGKKGVQAERREQINMAALKLFGSKGLAATKVSDIAKAAGISHGLIYHYFQSKEEIFTGLVELALDTSLGVFRYAAEQPGTPWERLVLATNMIVPQAYEGIGPYFFFLINEAFTSDAVPGQVKEMLPRGMKAYFHYLVPLIKEGQRLGEMIPGDPGKLATTYFALINGLAVISMLGNEIMPLPPAEMVLNLLRNPQVPEN